MTTQLVELADHVFVLFRRKEVEKVSSFVLPYIIRQSQCWIRQGELSECFVMSRFSLLGAMC